MSLNKELEKKLDELESKTQIEYEEEFLNPNNKYLFHAMRFHPIEILESILISKYILPGKLVPNSYVNYKGDEILIPNYTDDEENANHGNYISVIPYIDCLEFEIFIMENLFFMLKSNIHARETFYLKYDDYKEIMESNRKLKNLYSYAKNEYQVKEPISINKILKLGIFSTRIQTHGLEFNNYITKIINILKYYNTNFDFEDFSTNETYYKGNKEKTLLKTRI